MHSKLLKPLFWLYTISVILISVIPVSGNFDKIKIRLGPVALRMDYVLHASMFLVFFMIFMVASWLKVPLFSSHSRRNLYLLTLSLAFLTECLQLLMLGRTFTLLDMASNVIGVGIGMIVIGFITPSHYPVGG
jgi:hypothetical protein